MTDSSTLRLTEHFTLAEFTRSSTARKNNIDNTPPLSAIINLQQLCEHILEPLRQNFGAIVIASGFRSAILNRAVRGAARSQHLCGCACDIAVTSDERGKAMYLYIKEHLPFDQLISERNTKQSARWWIHVSYTDTPRKQVINNLIKYSK